MTTSSPPPATIASAASEDWDERVRAGEQLARWAHRNEIIPVLGSLLGAGQALSGLRPSIALTDDTLVVQGVFRRRRLPLGEVTGATVGDLGLRILAKDGNAIIPTGLQASTFRGRRPRRGDEVARAINAAVKRYARVTGAA